LTDTLYVVSIDNKEGRTTYTLYSLYLYSPV